MLRKLLIFKACPERDSNPQGLLHQILSLARLPIPPSGRASLFATYNAIKNLPRLKPDISTRSTLRYLPRRGLLHGTLLVILAAQVYLINDQRGSFSFENILDAFDTSFQYLALTTVEFLGQLDDRPLALGSHVNVV